MNCREIAAGGSRFRAPAACTCCKIRRRSRLPPGRGILPARATARNRPPRSGDGSMTLRIRGLGQREGPKTSGEPYSAHMTAPGISGDAAPDVGGTDSDLCRAARDLSDGARNLNCGAPGLSDGGRDLSGRARNLSHVARDLSHAGRNPNGGGSNLSHAARDPNDGGSDLSGRVLQRLGRPLEESRQPKKIPGSPRTGHGPRPDDCGRALERVGRAL